MIPANNIKFFQKLLKKTRVEEFKILKIFLNQDGELKTAKELYWSVEDDLRYIDWLEPQYLMPEIRQALEANEHFKACFNAFEFKKYVLERILPETLKDDIDAKLDDKETCLKFYRFLFKNRDSIDNPLKTGLKWFCGLGKNTSIETFQLQNIFFSNPAIDVIAQKGWLPESAFSVLSDDFAETDDDVEEWKKFWQEKFDVKEYEPESFIGAIILNPTPANKAAIVAHIADKNHNLNFYRYIFAHQGVINAHKKALLKSFPVWSYEDLCVIDSFNNNNIYLPDAYLLDVYASEIVPPLYEIVSNDFCESAAQSQEWRSFWHTYFDVKPYEVGSFVNTIILGNQEATNSHQKKDSTNSIKFWSYLLDNEKFISNPKQLSNFHVLIKHEEGDTTRFDKLSNCYLSDEYNEKGKGIEDFVKEFNPDDNNSFIAPTYLDGDNFIKWADFFKKCRINHETKDLVLNALLPKISSRTKEKSKKDIQLLFTLAKEIEGAGRFQELRNLKVLTIDGGYINLQNTFVTDSYSELNHVNDTLPSIILHHQISEEYLTPDADRKAWLDFWKKLMPVSHILDDKDKVIEQKLKCLVELQDTEGYRAKHLEHFKDVSELYESVKEAEEADKKIEKLSTKISHWKLTEKGVETGTETVALPTSFFLPSAYNPTFDYEGLGVTDLITIQFVSESYLAYPNAKEFLKYLGVCESITPNNLKVLTRPNAAHRFWELWLSTEWDINKSKSKDWFQKYITSALTCMPCGNTCKIPSNVYSLEIADYVVDKSRLPSIDLRNLIIDERSVEDFLEFKKIPSLPDCLTFLKTQPKREQFEKVVTWLKEYNPNISELPNNVSIQDFRQTGKWLNADSRWTNVNNLAYFGSYGSEMRRLFNSNSHRIKFPSGTSSQDEQKICTWLGIPMLLSESSFTITPTGENLDLDFAERLRERLPIIAFDAFSDKNWGEKAQNYLEILDEWKLYTCSKITLSYINVERGIILAPPAFKVKLFKEQKELFYIKSWNNLKTFIDLVNELSGIFGFKQKSDELRDLIYDPKFDVVDMLIEKGLTVPEDWKRPKPTTTNTAFANHGSLKTPNDAGSSTSDTSNSGTQTQTTQEPEEPKVYDPKIEQILRGLDGLNKNSQYSINRQTSGDALIWLEENGWNIENATAEFGILKDIAKDGYVYSIIVRSAKTGLLRLDQYNWNNLGLENYKLLVQTGGRLSDFILYDTQTELLNAPYNNQSIIVKQNTKQPTILTNMVEGLRDDDKATLYFITSEKGASIFNTLTGLKSHSDQESGSAPDSEL